MSTTAIDRANAEFWNELCGSGFARQLGIRDHSPESLRRFDAAYFALYPYLLRHVPVDAMRGRSVLEVGLGFGTLGQRIAEAGASYTGLDVAAGPVRMMNHRLATAGLGGRAVQGSMLECPFPDASFDHVVSIGCFHHTGDTQRCFDETLRVLRPGGSAHLMVYNRFSYRQWLRWPLRTLLGASSRAQRAAYDADGAGTAAPETQFFSAGELRRMLAGFRSVRVSRENCEEMRFRRWRIVPRERLLGSVGRRAGLDLYVRAEK